MSFCLKNHTLSPFVIMSFCLKKYICLPPSLCYSVFKTTPSVTPVPLLLCLQNYPVSLCHYVILSKKVHLSPPVPLLFCLQDQPFCYSCPPVTLSSKLPCLPFSLCHSVFKTTSVSPRPSVILSSRPTLLLLLSSCYSVFKTTLSPFVIMSFCLKNHICLAPSLCYSVFKTTPSVTPVLLLLCLQNYPVSLCHYVILF